jgi:hypothetical protein
MQNAHLWALVREASAALVARYEPAVESACATHQIDQRMWGLLLAVLTFEPEDTSTAHLLVRGPYTAAEAYHERLERAAESGLLKAVDAGTYRLTERGRQITMEVANQARQVMCEVDPLSAEDSERVAVLVDRLVQACLDNPSPPEPWSIRLSYKLMPAMRPPMPYIEQAFSCISAYRDDAHLAAWEDSGLSAMALESLTLFWQSDAASLDDLCRRLVHRGHPCQVYITVMEELRKRGFLQGPDQSPALTGAGRVYRNQVEAATDRVFFEPWRCLTEVEKAELGGLLKRMISGLEASN